MRRFHPATNRTPARAVAPAKRSEGGKKPAWAAMPVLDVRALNDKQVRRLARAYDALGNRELQALAKLNVDPVRRAIDEALSKALDLPDLAPLREMLAREPGLTGKAASGFPGSPLG